MVIFSMILLFVQFSASTPEKKQITCIKPEFSSFLTQPLVIVTFFMEFSDAQFRFYIFARAKLGDASKQIHEDLLRVVGNIAPCRRTIQPWM